MIIGAIFGYVSEKVAGMLMGAGDHRAAAKAKRQERKLARNVLAGGPLAPARPCFANNGVT